MVTGQAAVAGARALLDEASQAAERLDVLRALELLNQAIRAAQVTDDHVLLGECAILGEQLQVLATSRVELERAEELTEAVWGHEVASAREAAWGRDEWTEAIVGCGMILFLPLLILAAQVVTWIAYPGPLDCRDQSCMGAFFSLWLMLFALLICVGWLGHVARSARTRHRGTGRARR